MTAHVPACAAQVKTKGARRITFSQFVEALALIAAKLGGSLADVASAVLAADGPSVTGTKAEYVKFHDDKVRPNMITGRKKAMDNSHLPATGRLLRRYPDAHIQLSAEHQSQFAVLYMDHAHTELIVA